MYRVVFTGEAVTDTLYNFYNKCIFVKALPFEVSHPSCLQKWTLGDVVAPQMWIDVVQCL